MTASLANVHFLQPSRLWVPCLLLLSLTSCQSATTSETDFLAGKTLRITTSNSPGGGFDFYMRVTSRHLEATQDVAAAAQNIEGAGGTLGDNKLFHARPDGLTIGLINGPGHIFAQLRKHPGVRYDFREWRWLGRVAAVPPAIAVAPQSELQSLQDLIGSDRPIRFGLEGRGSDAYYGTVLLSNVLQVPVQQIVGYSGPGEITGAMLAGEIDARFESVDTLLPLIQQGELRLIFLLDRQRDSRLPDVAAIPDVKMSPQQREMLEAYASIYRLERSFVAPPGTPDERVTRLREILWKTWNDPTFQQELEAAGRGLQLMQGADLEQEAQNVAETMGLLAQLLEE